MAAGYACWGRLPIAAGEPVRLRWRDQALPAEGTLLAHGNGRSYGDSCLNPGGTLLDTRGLDRFVHFDRERGILRAEAGVLLAEIVRLIVPAGWFLPVTPGTRFVTLGGAIANDVHGKNHHVAGTFGRHVRALELHRSGGERLLCTPDQNPEWFAATIGGLGLTGLITWAEIALKPVPSAYVATETVRFGGVDEFIALNDASEQGHEYTVAWVDCLARGKQLGRGVFMRGNHARHMARAAAPALDDPALCVPLDAPAWLLGHATMAAFNGLYYRRARQGTRLRHIGPFFYPLDGIGQWNRLYGKRGFYQYQCVVTKADGGAALRELLDMVAQSGQGSFLAVLKGFGELPSPGLLSFPRPGYTLALDFANRGASTLALFERLDRVVEAAGGALYPAKDARMTATGFTRYHPRLDDFVRFVDPRFSSAFWRRVRPEAS